MLVCLQAILPQIAFCNFRHMANSSYKCLAVRTSILDRKLNKAQQNSVQLKVLHIVSMKFVSLSAIGVAPMLVVAHRNADSKCQQRSSERKINI